MKKLTAYIYCLSVIFAFGCAQQVGPTGGPKDTIPPKIVKSQPENFSVNFSGNEIKLYFNEFVQLNNFQTQLVVSPPLRETPAFRIRGKILELSFRDTLHTNTTYNFHFGNGIVDITEGNALDSNLFVFSTGENIDSLFVQGRVKNAFNLAPEKEVMVMLYNDFSDSVPYLFNPKYFARTKEDGTYKIQYVQEGKYKIFVLKDVNGNYFFDAPDEKIAFAETSVNAGDSAEHDFFLFTEESLTQFLKRGYAEHFGKLVFVFGNETKNARAVPLNHAFKKAWYIEELSEKKDTLIYWLTGLEGIDTLQIQVSDNNEILDTVEIILPEKAEEKEKKGFGKMKGRQMAFPQTLVINSNVKPGQPFDLFNALQLEAIHPVKSYDADEIILVEKEDTLKIKLNAVDKAMRKFEIKHQWKEATDYTVFIPPQTFVDIYDLKNDTVQINFKTRKRNEYGAINLKVDIPKTNGQYIIQLMDMSENILKEKIIKEKSALSFENIFPGKYKLKLIYDNNKNSKWDTGNYLKKIQPEKIIYYSDQIELRPKFDLELDWKVE